MYIAAYMLSCRERALVRRETQERLAATDWGAAARVVLDPGGDDCPQQRQSRAAREVLRRAIEEAPDFMLFLEDDLEFNDHLRCNLMAWEPLAGTPQGGHFFASLYNPNIRELRRDDARACFLADPEAVYGSQAFVLSLETARHVERHWETIPGMQDIRMSRLAAMVTGVYYHAPSLVQHVPVPSAWGGGYHSAVDYSPDWRSTRAANDCSRPSAAFQRETILERMRAVEGWLSDEEGGLLITIAAEAVQRPASGDEIACVEVGSFLGRSTVAIATAIKAAAPRNAHLYAIDPHEGDVTTLDHQVCRMGSTLARFTRTIGDAGLDDVVVPIVSRSTEVQWDRPIALLFVDGLHDYESVSADVAHFEPFVQDGGFIALHNCAVRFPGVERVAADYLRCGAYRRAHQAGSLLVLEKIPVT